jgi:hypothetical protein
MEDNMRRLNFGVVMGLSLTLASCSTFKKQQPQNTTAKTNTPESTAVQTENQNKEALARATSLTSGWPDSSIAAAKEMIEKYGDPQETTSDSLIWRNVAPFKEIIVHKEVYSHRFPLLHQNSLEHVVDYRAPIGKIDDVWRYNGSIVLNQTQGEMSSYAENEAMNVLALNLAHQVMAGKMSADAARITFGKETMSYLNGNKTAYTQVLNFGSQFNTADEGVSITNKIRWIGDPANQRRPAAQNVNTRQAQEEKK